jgi:hypothetical protein
MMLNSAVRAAEEIACADLSQPIRVDGKDQSLLRIICR